MAYESPLKIFRDEYKNPDLYENGRLKDQRVSLLKAGVDGNLEDEESENVVEKLHGHGEKYHQVVELIRSVVAKNLDDFPGEAAILKKRQELVLMYLKKILDDVENYLTQVNELQILRASDYDDHRKYQEVVKLADEQRRSYHNIMIQDIKTAIRLININFNADYPQESRVQEESRMMDRKGVSLEQLSKVMSQREYVKFPYSSGAFIDLASAPKDPQGEREFIADWALKIYADLSILEKDMSEKK